jgi:branched-chain amino acid transport system substrate-binding protein
MRSNDSEEEEIMFATLRLLPVVLAVALLVGSGVVLAEKKYGPGVTDTEIKIGQTMTYSGPLSAYGTIGRAEAAYFAKINAEGGINGRKIKLISLDDGYNPTKTVEQTRKLIEQEDVLLLFSPIGTPTNTAIHKYVNAKKVPHLVLATGATKWGDPQNFPWTMGWQLSYQIEAKIYASYILQNKPDAKIGVLYQNDDYGKDLLKGLKDGLGGKAARMIIAEVSYEPSDPTVDSQIVTLKGSGADTFINFSTPRAAAQAIRKVHDMGWKPLHIINKVASSVGVVLTPAGLEKSVGIISVSSQKDPTDPIWKNDPGVKKWLDWMQKYYPGGDTTDDSNVYGYNYAQTLVQILNQCGDDLTRENVMRQAANLKNLELPMLLPGIRINTSPSDYFPIKQAQMMRFDGKQWVRFGEIMAR